MKLPLIRYIKSHHVSRAALVCGVLVAAAVFFVVGAGVRLLVGPVSLGPLRGTLASAIHDALPGIALDYDQAAIEWSRDDGRIHLVVLGARLYDSQGRIVAQAPKADIDLAAAPLLSGRAQVKRITLVGVQLTLVHTREDGIRLGLEKSQDDIIARLRSVIESRGSGRSSLESFAVRNARLAILDEPTGLFVVAPKAQLQLRARGRDLTLHFDADAEISGHATHVVSNLTLPGEGSISGNLSVSELDLRALGSNSTMFSGVRHIPLVAALSAQFVLQPGGHFAAADFDVSAHGEIPVGMLASHALHVGALRLVGHYDGARRHLDLRRASLEAREGRLSAKGAGDFAFGADGKVARIDAVLNFDRVAVDVPGIFAGPVSYRSAQVAGAYLAGPRLFHVTRASLTAPGFELQASGDVTLNDKGAPGLVLKAHIPATPIRTLLRYWPLKAASGARSWIDANIFAGTIGPLDATTNFAPGQLDQDILPEASLNVSIPLQGVEGVYVRGLTHATGVDGLALLTGDSFHMTFAGGHMGPLQLSRGTALIPELHKVGTVGTFTVHADGAMTDVMTLIDMQPLGYPTRFGIDPKQTGGTVSADLSFTVPMLANLPVDDVGISVKAAVNDFAVQLGRTHFTNGAVNFEIDNNHLHQTGMLNLADARLNVDWTEDFKTTDPITTRLAVKGVMTEAGRAALNINLLRYFRGTVPITADITGHRGSLVKADVAVDFTPATLSVPIINLEKLPGQQAAGHIVADFAPGNALLDESIHIAGPVLNANGTASFTHDGQLSELDFPSVKMGPLNDFAFHLTPGAGSNDYVLRGHSLDGSKVGRNGTGEGASGKAATADDASLGRYHISAKLDRMVMRDGVSIAPFNLDLTGVGDRPAALSLNGNLSMGSRSAPITADLDAGGQGRKVTLAAGDTGLLVRGLFAFESMRGGKLEATVNLPGQASDSGSNDPDFSGKLKVQDFTMIHQPLLARLFSVGSFTGLGDLMGGDGMTMDELNMTFSSKNNVISVKDARVAGPAVGASADGYIDRPHGMIALTGSLVPAYGLNSFISNVPLIGDILASRKGEGIFGVTYSLSGDAEHPDLSTNPLSMLTPGILRRIFEGRIPTAANAPSNAPQPAPRPAQ